jgi:hypothetical protein
LAIIDRHVITALMGQMRLRSTIAWVVLFGLSGFWACSGDGVGEGTRALSAECVDPTATLPADAWMCGEERTVECTSPQGADVDVIYVVSSTITGPSCVPDEVQVNDPGPFALGTHTISVRAATVAAAPGLELCSSELRVVDTTPPRITAHTVELWPPNHKMHSVSLADCVTVEDICDPSVRVSFTRVTSDEPNDANGDGHHQPDIVATCGAVMVRAERQGGSDGRVYQLHVRAVDDSGNAATGVCRVVVPHDQSGRAAVDSGDVLTVAAPRCP